MQYVYARPCFNQAGAGGNYSVPPPNDVQDDYQPEHAQHLYWAAQGQRVCRRGKRGKSPPCHITPHDLYLLV